MASHLPLLTAQVWSSTVIVQRRYILRLT